MPACLPACAGHSSQLFTTHSPCFQPPPLHSSIKTFVSSFRARHSSLHLLVNNAGEFHPGPFALTADGLERVLAPNYWGHFMLTHALLDVLVGGGGCWWVVWASCCCYCCCAAGAGACW